VNFITQQVAISKLQKILLSRRTRKVSVRLLKNVHPIFELFFFLFFLYKGLLVVE